MARVTVLGTGAMGSRMAARLAESQHVVTVWNRSAEAAQRTAEAISASLAVSPEQAVAEADYVVCMLADDTASRDVWIDQGAIDALPAGCLAVEASTISPAWSRELEQALVTRGRPYVEAPVLGSLPQAESGQLIALVGGNPEAASAVNALVSAYCGRIEYVGLVGAATTVKLAINAFMAIQVAGLAELLDLTRRTGVDQDMLSDLLPTLPGTSTQMGRILPRMQAASYAPNFTIDLLLKDLGYALSAHPEATSLSMIPAAAQAFQRAREAGLGGLDFVAIDATMSSRVDR